MLIKTMKSFLIILTNVFFHKNFIVLLFIMQRVGALLNICPLESKSLDPSMQDIMCSVKNEIREKFLQVCDGYLVEPM
jgi:selenocysteine lyase/cysteine desulfurase